MRTVTFYSYKGGVGRSLALANVARYLTRLSQRVVVLDLDLRAPGLHYKLLPKATIQTGIVDVLQQALAGADIPPMSSLALPVPASEGSLQLIPAGAAPSAQYWSTLTQLDWKAIFYSGSPPPGVSLFLEIKNRIARELKPDYLLIDATTGITEVGSAALTLLADDALCLFALNQESIHGTRVLLESLRSAPRPKGAEALRMFQVLCRIPVVSEEQERRLLAEVKERLHGPGAVTDALFVLHSDPNLQVQESLKIDHPDTDEDPLFQDYLRLISAIIPRETIEAQLDPMILRSQQRAFEDPDAAQKELEALAQLHPHPQTYRALLKFYRLRQMGQSKLFGVAEKLYRLTHAPADPLLQSLVRDLQPGRSKESPCSLELLRDIWCALPEAELEQGLGFMRWALVAKKPGIVLSISERLPGADPRILQVLNEAGAHRAVLTRIEGETGWLEDAAFHTAWATATLKGGDAEAYKALLKHPAFRASEVFDAAPEILIALHDGAEVVV